MIRQAIKRCKAATTGRAIRVATGGGFTKRIHKSIAALVLMLTTTSCTRLATGRLNTLASPHTPMVLIIRGYLDWYSTGMDNLTTELRAAGIPSEAFREEQWGDVQKHLIANRPRPLILIGFSYGADDVITIARELNDRHRPVDLLVTIDPVTPAAIPANVKRCVNFYEPNGLWDVFPWLRGVPLHADAAAIPPTNINIRIREDLNEPATGHATIAGNEQIHREIVATVKQLLQ